MAEISKDKLPWVYERMRLIREFENRAARPSPLESALF